MQAIRVRDSEIPYNISSWEMNFFKELLKIDTALRWRAASRETDLSLANQNPRIQGQQVQREINKIIKF